MKYNIFKKYDAMLLLVFFFTVTFSISYLGLIDKFWFEDDPWAYAFVNKITNPLSIFYNPDIMRTFGTGASVVPMQMLSYWIDVKIFGVSPLAAYLHSVISLVLTTLLLYSVFVNLTKDKVASVIISSLWLFLPSTIAVHYFISTRHYLEGFGWSLLACWLTMKKCDQADDKNNMLIYCIALSILAAMLSKELYITTLPPFIIFYAMSKKKYLVCALQIIIMIAYIFYRFWLIGGVGKYPVSMLGIKHYLVYLKILPFTLAFGYGGYIIFGGLAIGSIWLMYTQFQKVYKPLLMILVLIVTALIASYPTASPVLSSFNIPGTWYRGSFIINTLLFLSTGYLLAKYASRYVQVACLVIVIIILIPGAHKTRAYWNYRLLNAELEGKFYIDNPDKLLLSQEHAEWYIKGIDALYEVNRPHYINTQTLTCDHAKQMVNQFQTIWRIEKSLPFPDQELYWKIKFLNSK